MFSLIAVPVLVVLAGFVLSIAKHLASPLRSVPGPFLARFTNAWYLLSLRGGKFQTINQQLHQKYGPIVRYGPNRYSFNDAEAIKTIYGPGTQYTKSSWYSAWGAPGSWTIFSDTNAQRHNQNRRLYASTFSMTSLVSYEPYAEECTEIFCQRLSEMSQNPDAVNLGHWLQCYTFDTLGCITFSKRFGFLDQGRDVGGVMSAIDTFFCQSTFLGVYSSLYPYIFNAMTKLAGPSSMGRAYMMKFTKDRIDEHQAAPKLMDPDESEESNSGKATDFLTKFLVKHSNDPDVFTKYHVVSGCTSNVAAGSDTTSGTISAMLYYLLKNSECLEKLRAEVDNAYAQHDEAEKSAIKNISFSESQKLPYLQAVVKEALRMHPASGLPLERVVPPGGATISGKYFPEGTIVGINAWVEHFNTDVFGSDADKFRPERWLCDDADKVSLMNRHWMGFGMGSFTCIGRHIANLTMSKMMPRLIRDFDFELAGYLKAPEASWRIRNYWFVKPTDFLVQVRPRGVDVTGEVGN